MENKKNFSQIITALRASSNLSQEKFGELFGVKKSTVSGWESRFSMPPVAVLIKIAEYFKVTTDHLLGIDNSKLIRVDDLNERQVKIIENIIAEFKGKKNG